VPKAGAFHKTTLESQDEGKVQASSDASPRRRLLVLDLDGLFMAAQGSAGITPISAAEPGGVGAATGDGGAPNCGRPQLKPFLGFCRQFFDVAAVTSSSSSSLSSSQCDIADASVVADRLGAQHEALVGKVHADKFLWAWENTTNVDTDDTATDQPTLATKLAEGGWDSTNTLLLGMYSTPAIQIVERKCVQAYDQTDEHLHSNPPIDRPLLAGVVACARWSCLRV
jgi:hypothetical protein